MITVYYDGKCGLCRREILYYKRIAPEDIFDWQDVATSPDAFRAKGYKQSDGLKLLHAEDSDGLMHIGLDAFIVLWKQLRYWRWLAALVSLPGVHGITDRIYRAFAVWRFKRHPHCQIALKDEQP